MEEIPNPYVETWQTDTSARQQSPRSSRDEVIAFALKHQAKKVVATRLIAFGCVAMFIVVSITDKSLITPDRDVMLKYGANFGPFVVFKGETWRLFTCTFLHFGLIHLAMNLWCLSSAGPVLERFLGSLPFAALYVLAGLGGSIASLWVHPTSVGAGASGAVFGVFGGLLGYLAVRRHEVPTAVLQPMRSGVMAFIFYNVVLGFSTPTTDNAAHLGGLATGFLTGLMMTAAQSIGSTGLLRLMLQLAVVLVVAAGLTGLEHKGIAIADRALRKNPYIVGEYLALPAYSDFLKVATPVMIDLARNEKEINRVISPGAPQQKAELDATLLKLSTDLDALGKQIEAIPARNEEIAAMRERLSGARDRQIQIVNAFRKSLATGDASVLDGPMGFQAQFQAYENEVKDLNALRNAYFLKYGLKTESP